jgi:hypothetical protein
MFLQNTPRRPTRLGKAIIALETAFFNLRSGMIASHGDQPAA